ncbi:hypothetical protein B0H10DRAFT_1671118, partial [Mycena sp. CBHHK59/15]
MLKCMNKYGVSFETSNPTNEMLRKLPLWHHPGEDGDKRQENNGKVARCLRRNHAALTIGEGVDVAQRLHNPLHANRKTCACDECEVDREVHGCENPHGCATKAASRLKQIRPRWIPKQESGE